MLNESNSFLFNAVNNSVRIQTNIRSTNYTNWRNQVRWIYKSGNNTNPSNGVNGYVTCCGAISLPFRSANGTITPRVFMFGMFVNNSTTSFQNSRGETAVTELLREQITASMNTFK
jgi:hypothetical protein